MNQPLAGASDGSHSLQAKLTREDRALLAGEHGPAAAFGMQRLLTLAEHVGAQGFVSVHSAHVASGYDNTPVNWDFARKLADWSAQVRIPTTLTACALNTAQQPVGISRQHELNALYQSMGCKLALSCAPYLGYLEPGPGEVLAWSESSAVVYANSVIGARCNRYPEFLDMCAALTGRVPDFGMTTSAGRRASVLVDLRNIGDDFWQQSSWPGLLGIWLGLQCGGQVPALLGLPEDTDRAALRELGAAAASSGAIDMFHAVGFTPEAPTLEQAFQQQPADSVLTPRSDKLQSVTRHLSRQRGRLLSALCIGAPHASAEELRKVLALLNGRTIHPSINCYLTTNQAVIGELKAGGEFDLLQQAGCHFVTGRCSYYAPVLTGCSEHVLTNSAKWAWYAQRQLDCDVSFGELSWCVDCACEGGILKNS